MWCALELIVATDRSLPVQLRNPHSDASETLQDPFRRLCAAQALLPHLLQLHGEKSLRCRLPCSLCCSVCCIYKSSNVLAANRRCRALKWTFFTRCASLQAPKITICLVGLRRLCGRPDVRYLCLRRAPTRWSAAYSSWSSSSPCAGHSLPFTCQATRPVHPPNVLSRRHLKRPKGVNTGGGTPDVRPCHALLATENSECLKSMHQTRMNPFPYVDSVSALELGMETRSYSQRVLEEVNSIAGIATSFSPTTAFTPSQVHTSDRAESVCAWCQFPAS